MTHSLYIDNKREIILPKFGSCILVGKENVGKKLNVENKK
jgi:hypothetical protein